MNRQLHDDLERLVGRSAAHGYRVGFEAGAASAERAKDWLAAICAIVGLVVGMAIGVSL